MTKKTEHLVVADTNPNGLVLDKGVIKCVSRSILKL